MQDRGAPVLRCLGIHNRLQRFVLDVYLLRAVGGLLAALPQHQGHGLPNIVHPSDCQRRMRRHRTAADIAGEHDGPAEGAGGHHVFRQAAHLADAGVRMGTAHHRDVPDSWHGNIVDECAAAHQ